MSLQQQPKGIIYFSRYLHIISSDTQAACGSVLNTYLAQVVSQWTLDLTLDLDTEIASIHLASH